ncbi:MAG: DUF3868 domain-containing protein [Bacteroidales bacterium]|nr:DUF3868 domain-containing protein [Bacteroidales bacterium]
MKKTILSVIAVAFSAIALYAQSDKAVNVSAVTLERGAEGLTVSMKVDLGGVKPYANKAVTLTPVLFNGEVEKTLKPIAVYSRGRYLSVARDARSAEPFGQDEYMYLKKNAPSPLHYTDTVEYESWMDGSQLRIDAVEVGCCGKKGSVIAGNVIGEYVEPEPEIIEFIPNYIYVQPDADVKAKERSISGEAFVIFKTGKTNLDPAFQNNESELAKIRATIDSVRNDNDITITQIVLRGYSSPDGSYKNNEKFAKARTEALKDYVSGLYPFPEDVWVTESVAENWEGLRKAVEESDALGSKDKILAVIDGDLAPDKKEAKLKSSFPKDYKYLLNNVFPTLRRTDYKVSYTVRSYSTVEEVREILATRPWNLSIEEFFLASQGMEPGTPEFNNVFATAARVYPFDEVANINAANAFMSAGDLDRAQKYLNRTGDSAVARYTKGVFHALDGDFEKALELFSGAEKDGLGEASQAKALTQLIIDQRKSLEK